MSESLARLQRASFVVGGAGTLLCLGGALLDGGAFFPAYLFAYLLWAGIALGCLVTLMFYHLGGGEQSTHPTRTLLEAGALTLPLLGVLFLPLLLGLDTLYPWARSQGAPPHLRAFLNQPAFMLRSALYFVLWIGLALALTRPHRQPHLSRVGLLIYLPSASLAAIDWSMSLEVPWASSIYPALLMGGQLLGGGALTLLLLYGTPSHGTQAHRRWLNNMLLITLLLTAYFAYTQYLIIWSGNLPSEVGWYLRRSQGGWEIIALLLLLGYLVLPFLLLLARQQLESRLLAVSAALLLLLRLLEQGWLLLPPFRPSLAQLHWLDGTVPLALGGLWLALFLWLFERLRTREEVQDA